LLKDNKENDLKYYIPILIIGTLIVGAAIVLFDLYLGTSDVSLVDFISHFPLKPIFAGPSFVF